MPACGSCGETVPDHARFCPECGAALAASQAGSEARKVVTILFCDVVGSTAIGERADAETIRTVMGRYFELARHAIEAHGGTVEKFIGDAVMAVFGVPQLHEDDPMRAVRAALAIQSGLERLNRETGQPQEGGLRVRIGIATGEVVAGPPGGQTLVTGDPVNTAARIEQAAAPGTVVIGELTERLVRGKVVTIAMDAIEAKGKSEPVRVFRVDDTADDPARHAETPLVGREVELTRVLAAVERSIDSRSVQLITLIAQPGVGKSRLIQAAESELPAAVQVLRGRCLPYGDGVATWPIREAFRSAAGIEDGDATDAVVAKLAARAAPDPSAEAIGAGVAQMMGIGGIGVGQDDAFWAIRRLLEKMAQETPVVAIFEDLHWADAVFLELLEYIVDLSSGAPITIITTARPELLESRPSWAAGRLSVEIVRLEGLDEAGAARLCRSLEGGEALPEAVVMRIVEAAEGNPLFIEEMVASLRDEGILRREDSTWSMDDSEIAVPPSVKALLAARLDRLPEPTRAVVERGAVIGRIFETLALAQIAPENLRASLTGHLLTLVRREFIRPARSDIGSGDAYAFRHVLIRDAAYDALSKRDRAELHERIATWIESVSGDELSQFQEVVAHHLEQAYRYRLSLGEADEHTTALAQRAATHLSVIGERSLAAGSLNPAVAAFSRAIELSGESPPPMLLLNAGDAMVRSGNLDGIELLRDAVASAEARDDRQLVALATAVGAMFEIGSGLLTINDAIPRIERAVEVVETEGDPASLARAKGALHYALWGAGQLGETARIGEQVIEHWRAAGQPARAARSTALTSGTMVDGPTPVPDAIARCERWMLDVGESRNARYVLLESLGNLALLEGRFDDARALMQESRAIARELGQWPEVLLTSVELAEVEVQAGNLAEAEALVGTVPESLEQMLPVQAVLAFSALSRIRTMRGQPAAALATLRLEPADDGDILVRSTWFRAAAFAHLGLGQYDEAERHVRTALDALEPTDVLTFRADAFEILADIQAARGQIDAASEHLGAAIRLYEEKQATARLARARHRLDELTSRHPPTS